MINLLTYFPWDWWCSHCVTSLQIWCAGRRPAFFGWTFCFLCQLSKSSEPMSLLQPHKCHQYEKKLFNDMLQYNRKKRPTACDVVQKLKDIDKRRIMGIQTQPIYNCCGYLHKLFVLCFILCFMWWTFANIIMLLCWCTWSSPNLSCCGVILPQKYPFCSYTKPTKNTEKSPQFSIFHFSQGCAFWYWDTSLLLYWLQQQIN